ncbi:carbohydrate kinase family protein [Microbacterium sp. NPDC058345]|uniref:carbohydrate kinase family protein n=1 Tax=Microbacterium sp. NPDC058345 TaxID=3346455 RepID=UPI003657809A
MSCIAVVGAVSWNTLVLLDDLPAPTPHMQFARGDWQTLGGTSAGKALALAALGRRVRLRARVGSDAAGARIRAALDGAGIGLEDLVVTGTSERHLNLMTPRGERVSLYLSTPEAPPTVADPVELFSDAAAIVLDLSDEGLAAIPAARASGRPIWVDPHDWDGVQDFHRPFLDAAHAVLCSADRLDDPAAFLRSCVAGGVALAVCTRGAEGAIAVDASGELHAVPAVPVDVVDTNGAGDAFFAGVLNATLGGAAVQAALTAGARSAAAALRSRHLHPLLDDVLV